MGEHDIYSEDPLQVYTEELRHIPLIDAIEENSCIEHVRANDRDADVSRTRLLEAYLHLVVPIAERYGNRQVHTLYLIEKGNAGLLRAVDVLAGCRPDSFSRHALKFIEQAIVAAAAGS